MNVAITGSSGYIGSKVIQKLNTSGIHTIPIQRAQLEEGSKELIGILSECDGVINLAGAPVLQRWTNKNKQAIYNSRIATTRILAEAINHLPKEKRPRFFLTASAIGLYSSGKTHDESSTDFASDFLGQLVSDWEKASTNLHASVRRVVFRISLVLGHDSKTIQSMLPAFKLGLGGNIASGYQPFPFIHIDDLCEAVLQGCTQEQFTGIYNLAAPVAINNREFTQALSKQLHRPALLPIPGFLLKAIFGEAANLLLQSPSVVPQRLLHEGFSFSRPTIEDALNDIR